MIDQHSNIPTESLWGIDEFAHYLGVAKDTIYHWRKTGVPHPPAIRYGKHLRWNPEDVRAWERQSQGSRP